MSSFAHNAVRVERHLSNNFFMRPTVRAPGLFRGFSGVRAAAVWLTLSLLAACDTSTPDARLSASAPIASPATEAPVPASVRLDATSGDTVRPSSSDPRTTPPAAVASSTVAGRSQPVDSATAARTPDEYGRIPILEYHLVVDEDGSYAVSRERFRAELDTLYARGYRPISLTELLDKRIDLARGLSPVLFVFDDASPSQFRYVLRDSVPVIDSSSALGIWLAFARDKPDWRNRGLFCLLSGAEAGRSFFGNKGIEGQETAWRFAKLQQLDSLGFELCNHTLWHARLDKYADGFVQEQIARGELAIDSAIPGYRVRGFALPLGMWPKNRALASRGSWTDPRSGRVVSYDYDAVFEVAGGPARSPYDAKFTPQSLPRVPLFRNAPLSTTLRSLERDSLARRYVSDGDPNTVSGRPRP